MIFDGKQQNSGKWHDLGFKQQNSGKCYGLVHAEAEKHQDSRAATS
jgi:hypothetical protein